MPERNRKRRRVVCSSCGETNRSAARYCDACAHPIQPQVWPPPLPVRESFTGSAAITGRDVSVTQTISAPMSSAVDGDGHHLVAVNSPNAHQVQVHYGAATQHPRIRRVNTRQRRLITKRRTVALLILSVAGSV